MLAETLRLLHTEPLDGLPPLTGGMVGYLGYDVVRRLERIGTEQVRAGRRGRRARRPGTGHAAGHRPGRAGPSRGTVTLIANAVNWDATDERVDAAYDAAVGRLRGR